MAERLVAPKRVKALLRSRWGVFALGGLATGVLLLTGMLVQAGSAPSLEPLRLESRSAEEDVTVWILFQRLDCVASRWKIEGWADVASRKGIRVIAWALDSSDGWPPDMDPVRRLDVGFELREGPSPDLSRTLRALGVSVTPAVLVVDRVGRLRRVVPGSVLRSAEDLERIMSEVEVLDV